MITSISVENFKSYGARARLPLSPLTLLIGTNASGKSNLIEAIRLLSLLAHGRRLDDIFSSVQREDIAIRGTVRNLLYDGRDTFALGCTLSGETVGEWDELQMRIKVSESDREMRLVEESISSRSSVVPLYEIKHPAGRHSNEVQVAYNNFAQGGRKPLIPCTDQQAIFTQLDTPSRFGRPESQQHIPRVVLAYQQSLKSILFLDPSPRQMRDYSFITEVDLLDDGRNLSSVLYHLCQNEGRKQDVLDFISYLPEHEIRDIDFVMTPRREVMVKLVETFACEEVERDAPVLSDGTLRVLAVAAALLSARAGSLVIIEEIDNGVHPSRAGQLLANIRRIATERSLRVLLTSHNPALLDTLPSEAVPDVVACYRDPDEGDSRLVRLKDLRRYPALAARGPLGHLMTEGILESYLKDQRSEEEEKEQAFSWLEEFEKQTATMD